MQEPQIKVQNRIRKNLAILRSKIATGKFTLQKKHQLEILNLQLEKVD